LHQLIKRAKKKMDVKIKAAFSLSGIKGILWIIIGAIFLVFQPLGAPLGLGFSFVGFLIILIGILDFLQVIGMFAKSST